MTKTEQPIRVVVKPRFANVILWCALMVALSGCGQSQRQPDVVLFAATSTIDVVSELVDSFEAAHPEYKVRVNFAATSSLALMLKNGAEADLFLSADQTWAENVGQAIGCQQQLDLWGNRLVVVVPTDSNESVVSLDQLIQSDVQRIAMALPDVVPAGRYAKEYWQSNNSWTIIEPKVVGASDVRQALALVVQGAVDCGVVYETDARSAGDRVRRIGQLPDVNVVYPLVQLENHRNPTAVSKFIGWLQQESSRTTAAKYGFSIPDASWVDDGAGDSSTVLEVDDER